MAELGNQVEPSGGAAATAPLAQGAPGGALAPEPMLLQVPAPGEVLAVTAAAGAAYVVDPAAQGLGLEMAWRGDDLVLAFSGAGSIRLQGAARLKSLTLSQNACAEGAVKKTPSIGLFASC